MPLTSGEPALLTSTVEYRCISSLWYEKNRGRGKGCQNVCIASRFTKSS